MDGSVRLWNVQDGTCLATLRDHTNGVRSVAFAPQRDANSPDGYILASGRNYTLASGRNDHTVRLWDVRDGTCLRTLQGRTC